MTTELWFHGIEIAIMLFGVAMPVTVTGFRIMSVLKDFPPHRHVNHTIQYPRGFEPPHSDTLE